MNKTNRMEPYWASVEPKEIADRILDKVENYYEYLSMSGRLDLYRRSWLYYYRPRITGGMLNPAGQQGELTALSVNHYRNLLLHLETMTVQDRANFEPMATNSDQKSQAQVILAASLLDYYMRQKKLERNIKFSVKECLIFGEAYVRAEWDATAGKAFGANGDGAILNQGDMKYTNYNPLSNIRDYTRDSSSNEPWNILRDFENKYSLAAQFPELSDRILEDSDDELEMVRTTVFGYAQMDETDNVAVFTLVHKPTPAMPKGRFTRILYNGTVLMDGPLPYEETHVYRIAPDEETGTIFGYTVGFDLLPVQEAIDILYSTVITNQSTFGVQNVLAPKGADLSTSQFAGGLNVVEYDPKTGKPEAMNLTSTPKEIFEFIQQLQNVQQMIAGVDSVSRGDPSASLKSGSALALVASQSIQFSMGLQQSYAQLVEDLGTGTINILKVYAATPRVAEITGKSNRPLLKEFKGSDLDSISRVTVDMGNPMMKTTAGKTNLADTLMEKNMIENPDQYVQVITTGRFEPVVEGKQANLLLIKGENEGLSEGRPQRALITDEHAKHILEHSIVLANPEIRSNPSDPIVQMTLDHIQEHVNFSQSPFYQQIAASLGHELMMAPMAPPPMPGGDAAGGAGNMLNPAPSVMQAADDVNMPNPPNAPPNADPRSAELIQNQAV